MSAHCAAGDTFVTHSPSLPLDCSHRLEKAGLGVSGYYHIKTNLLPHAAASFLARRPAAASIIGRWVIVPLLAITIDPDKDERTRVALGKKNDDDADGGGEKCHHASSFHANTSNSFSKLSYVPLTTASRRELTSHSPGERMDQLVRYLDHHIVAVPSRESKEDHDARSCAGDGDEDARRSSSSAAEASWTETLSDESLVGLFRSDVTCRRLASLAMRPPDEHDDGGRDATPRGTTETSSTSTDRGRQHFDDAASFLSGRLVELWPRLLALPPLGRYSPEAPRGVVVAPASGDAAPPPSPPSSSFPFRISLIVPAYREDGDRVRRRLDRARGACTDPAAVEVLLVDAGGCTDLDDDAVSSPTTRTTGVESSWGGAAVHRFAGGGGRGPCLNFGAGLARGQIFTFLHSDTILPTGWDTRICETLVCDVGGVDPGRRRRGRGTGTSMRRANSCAFSFGIDCTPAGLGLDGGTGTTVVPPPGIRAVRTTANWRTRLFSLPYGDQVLSVPSEVFRHVGGFPDQCLMEDYELVDLLRRRAAISSRPVHGSNGPTIAEGERVAIIGGPPALCSPRRWQKCGVLYVTFMNSRFVGLYKCGIVGPNELFRKYYGADPPPRTTECSGWESDLHDVLVQKAITKSNSLA